MVFFALDKLLVPVNYVFLLYLWELIRVCLRSEYEALLLIDFISKLLLFAALVLALVVQSLMMR